MELLRRSPQGYRRSLCRNANLELYWFDSDEALLHVISSGALYPLDATGLYAWFALEGGMGEAQLIRELLGRGGAESDTPHFVSQLLKLRDGEVPEEPDEVGVDVPAWDAVPSDQLGGENADYRVLDIGVRFSGATHELARELAEILAPCSTSQPYPTHLELRIETKGQSQRVVANGYCVASGLESKNLLPILLDGVRRYAYLHSSFALALHAAALGRNDHRLLLPGSSGSGKSTLTAGLMARGWCVYSDEVAVLDGPDYQLRPLPVGVGIKSGGWPVLERFFYAITEIPIQERRNGVRMRYLPIPLARAASVVQPATHLVFPRYQQGAATAYKSLSVVEAIRYFQNCDYHLASPLGSKGVTALLDWLVSIPRFALTFDEIDAALDGLESLS